ENQGADGGFRYMPGGTPTEGATGAGTFARCLFGLTSHGRIEDGWAWLERQTKTAPDLSRMRSWQYLYSWYYRTLAAHQMQGAAWRGWNGRIRPFLVSTQRTRGHAAGSWPFIDYEQASTVYATALCVLMLETYYRYEPRAVEPQAAVDSLVGRADGAPATPEEERRIDAVVPPTPEVLAARLKRDREEARRRLSAEGPEVRYLGARRLAELGDREALPSMIAAADQETGRLRAAHLLFIGKLKDERAVDFLMQELENPDADVRTAAASALGAITGVYLNETSRWKEWHRSWKASRR
ncbi:MAG TPA: HEAT repeat domain-containing protein, partial [Planctomycetota bacterium]|nr:HEAT repeat domain-containing protein [Planctomycetota bacterium]